MKLLARVAFGPLALVLALGFAAPASAQESKSASLAKQLAAALDAAEAPDPH